MLTLAQKVKYLRRKLHLTTYELAEKTHISSSYISQIQCGRRIPAADEFYRLAAALGCSVSYLREGQ